ncbi:MAG: SusC/RagA family TonB-linked outer membrane protein, partial [Chlamydiia bacterium]|nr:SusC/RagA family TonB-linked outer membrane protein [Chlamydiia bacterium]
QIYGTTFERNSDGQIIVDEDGMPNEAQDPEVLGNVNPEWYGGITNSFSYKSFRLSFLVDFRKGGDVFSMTKAVGQKAGILQATVEDGIRESGMTVEGVYEDGAMVDLNGDGNLQDASGHTNISEVSARSYWRNSRDWGELSIVDGSFIKLREVTLSYQMPKAFLTKIGIQNVVFSVFGRNLALLYTHASNDAHIDPEVSSGGTVGGTGLEAYQLPPTRTLGFKLNFKF